MGVAILVIGVILLAGSIWQVYLWGRDIDSADEDDGPLSWLKGPYAIRQLGIGLIAGTVAFFGISGWGIIAYFDPNRHDWGILSVLCAFFKGGVIGVALLIKSMCSALFLAFVLASFVYFMAEYNQMHSVPVVTALFNWAFDGLASKPLGNECVVIVTIYSVISSVYGSVEGFHPADHMSQ
jgi:hypothetical protein